MSKKNAWEGNPSKRLCILDFFMGLESFFIVSILLWGISNFYDFEANLKLGLEKIILAVLVLSLGGTLIKIISDLIYIKSVKYSLKKDRLIYKRGILNTRIDNLELYRVDDILIEQNFIYKLLNVADIILTTSDISTPVIRLEAIENFADVHEKVRNYVERTREKRLIETSMMKES